MYTGSFSFNLIKVLTMALVFAFIIFAAFADESVGDFKPGIANLNYKSIESGGHFSFRELENINIPELRRNFWSYSRHVNRRITGYVTVDATKKTIKKASKFGILIFGSSLNNNKWHTQQLLNHASPAMDTITNSRNWLPTPPPG